MAEQGDSERTEDATPQRREDFRKRGQVAQSREVGSVLVLLSSLLAMWMMGRFFLDQVYQVFTRSFSDYLVMGLWQ
jgi:flagellar biosynthetic protein FlhB